jgi:hypothetical protein
MGHPFLFFYAVEVLSFEADWGCGDGRERVGRAFYNVNLRRGSPVVCWSCYKTSHPAEERRMGHPVLFFYAVEVLSFEPDWK